MLPSFLAEDRPPGQPGSARLSGCRHALDFRKAASRASAIISARALQMGVHPLALPRAAIVDTLTPPRKKNTYNGDTSCRPWPPPCRSRARRAAAWSVRQCAAPTGSGPQSRPRQMWTPIAHRTSFVRQPNPRIRRVYPANKFSEFHLLLRKWSSMNTARKFWLPV